MHLQPAQSAGPRAEPNDTSKPAPPKPVSSSLPFGHHVGLSSINPATYLTAQTLVQQTSYLLSDKLFTYSPDTFDLDLALERWEQQAEKNAHGFVPAVQQMQTRTGAGAVALGYMFSPDFDMTKRHIPQSIIASSGSLSNLRSSLDQLSLLYSVASPVAIQLAAVDYTARDISGLVTDYVTPQTLAEDLGLSMVASTSIYESQHMALLATLMARNAPSIHVFDGINVGRETTRVVDVLGKEGLTNSYKNVARDISGDAYAQLDASSKALKLFEAFNDELGTDYKPFEYYGHPEAETVLVVFGSVEGALAAQVAHACAQTGAKVGAINVRLYRPFIEDAFVESLPQSTKSISVLGQVMDGAAVADAGETSNLYSDVLAAVAFSSKFSTAPAIADVKYARTEIWTPSKIALALGSQREDDILGPSVQQYSLWDLDASSSPSAAVSVAHLLANHVPENVAVRAVHNTLARGGTYRADIRTSSRSIEAPYSVAASTVTYVGHEDVFKDFNVLNSVKEQGVVIARLPGSKMQDEEKFAKRIPEIVRKELVTKGVRFFVLDNEASPTAAEGPELEALLMQLAFLKLADTAGRVPHSKHEAHHSKEQVVNALADLEIVFFELTYPESWKTLEVAPATKMIPKDVHIDSFVRFPEDDAEPVPALTNSTTAAQALAFREAFDTKDAVRPDAGATMFTVHVKEHRRLTPMSYDRNIFHIEFDLGSSGLKYSLGEALGIHAENNSGDVMQFIDWYNLNAEQIVSVPSRADPDHSNENRTIFQALMQNIDIFGRPPKRFYNDLSEFATDETEKKDLKALGGPEAAVEFKRRAEVDTVTFADVLLEYPSAHPDFADIVRLVSPLKRREYSIASSQHVQPNSVSLLIVTVGWVDPKGRDRFGQATRYLDNLRVGDPVSVSVKPSVMKLPKETTAPIVMAGLGTGLAPFRAFVQERAYQRDVLGQPIGAVMLFLGSRHQREEYLYGEEWEAYQDAGIITHMGCAFSRDQPQKIYIQGRMREAMDDIQRAMWKESGAFYLCGPTWPVPDVTEVLEESVMKERREAGAKKVNSRREIEELKDEGRYVLEVY